MQKKGLRIEKRINVPASKVDSIDDNTTELTLPGFPLLVPSGIATFLPETYLGKSILKSLRLKLENFGKWRTKSMRVTSTCIIL